MSTEPEDPIPPEETDEDRGIQDMFRRAIKSGVRTVREGEERIRDIASAIAANEKVEAVTTTLGQVREDLVGVAGRELRRYLDRLNLTDEIVKVLTAISLEVKTEIRFIPNDKKLVTPSVKADVSVKRTRKQKKRRKSSDESPPVAADKTDDENQA